jgi:probable phosphoglycerate mutase
MTQLLLIRHGQSTWNADGRWQGQSDPPLSELGEQQAEAASKAVRDVVAVWSSDLVRAVRTAELMAPAGIAVQLEPGLRERNAGEWTGLTREEIEERYPGDLAAWRSPPGFEGDDPLMARVIASLEGIAVADAGAGTILVITHGGVIRTVERLLGAPSEPVPNLGGRMIDVAPGTLEVGERRLLIDPDDVDITVPRQL